MSEKRRLTMKVKLQKNFFSHFKNDFINYGNFKIKIFRYSSGVEALEIENSKCSFVFTPFKGQQIWHFKVEGKEISMKTTIKEPKNTMMYLENYGGFLYHCGIISFGAEDILHPRHGEIPNAVYDSAYICCDEDEKGKYIRLGGELNHDTAFVRKYKFCPEIMLYEDSSVFKINVRIENLRAYPMEYMYLCHINFCPIDGAKIICSAKQDLEHIHICHTDGSDKLVNYMNLLKKDITYMNDVGAENQCYDPEMCFVVKYEADIGGRGYTLQYNNEGACYVSHPVGILNSGIRWISRTENEDAMGMVLPATTEYMGFENAKRNGGFKILEANQTLEFYIEAGYLCKVDADKVKEKIAAIIY